MCQNWQALTASQQMKCTSSAEKGRATHGHPSGRGSVSPDAFLSLAKLTHHLRAVLSGRPILTKGKCRKAQSITMTTTIQLQKIACNEICIHLNLSLFNFTVSGEKKETGLVESL